MVSYPSQWEVVLEGDSRGQFSAGWTEKTRSARNVSRISAVNFSEEKVFAKKLTLRFQNAEVIVSG